MTATVPLPLLFEGELAEHHVRHLFLLVGTNPLPNYVAARVLCRKGGEVILLHSEEDTPSGRRSTKRYADFLRDVLFQTRPDLCTTPRGVHESDSNLIVATISNILAAIPRDESVGLNYTGGTKPMSVHTYQTIARKRDGATFSYLDAGNQTLYIEDSRGNQLHKRIIYNIPINLRQLAKLHGYNMEPTRREPKHLSLAQRIARLHQTPEGQQLWRNELKPDPLVSLPDPMSVPEMAGVRAAMDEMCGGTATPAALAAVLLPNSPQLRLNSCRKWLQGGWLEEITLDAVVNLTAEKHLGDCGVNLIPRPVPTPDGRDSASVEFEVDVAALQGHRLYLFSCVAGDEKGLATKHHLFEAFTRARQLGGDEAHAALICLAQKPEHLTRQLERDWQAWGRLRVFGREDVGDLTKALAGWIPTPVS